MVKNISFFIIFFVTMSISPFVSGDCVEECVIKAACPKFEARKNGDCEDSQLKCEEDCQNKADEDDVMFTGTKFTDGNTMILQGERIAAPLSAFQGGGLKPEDLALFRKNIVSSTNANGTVSVSTSSSRHGWLTGNHTRQTQNTDVTYADA